MKLISNILKLNADIIEQEILSDTSKWVNPNETTFTFPQVSPQVNYVIKLKFINGNLNFMNLPNMVVSAIAETQKYHPGLIKTLDFCNYVRALTNDIAPFGRMVVWCIAPNSEITPHMDKFPYHMKVIRNIFVISDNIDNQLQININNQPVPINKGTLFQFRPSEEIHSFINGSDKPFYFLGFDFWNIEELFKERANIDIDAIMSHPDRFSKFGGKDTGCKYFSPD